MVGAIFGDIIDSRFEEVNGSPYDSFKSKVFELLTKDCIATDDSIMTMAIAKAIFESQKYFSKLGEKAIRCMQEFGRRV